jgi:quercetin dioxygenase-like cupin family protein
MKTIRAFLFVFLLSLLPVSTVMAHEHEHSNEIAASGPITVSQAKFPLKVQGADYDLLTTIMDFPPGAGVARHFHGGHVQVTVLSGEMTLKEKGAERVVKSGESWTENPGDQHSVVNAGTVIARVAVSMLLPKGAEANTIVK